MARCLIPLPITTSAHAVALSSVTMMRGCLMSVYVKCGLVVVRTGFLVIRHNIGILGYSSLTAATQRQFRGW